MPRTPRRKPSKTKKSPRRGGRFLVLALFIIVGAFAVYIGFLNSLINARFEGDTWALPSRVYARSLELYPGLRLSGEQLEYELRLSSFLEVDTEPLPGQYRLLGESIEVHSRAFTFTDQLQPPRLLQVFFKTDQVNALIDADSGVDLALFRLPPVIIGSYYPDNGEDRLLLSRKNIPQRLLDSLIAVEDREFFEHWGLSPQAIVRAFLANLAAAKTVQGGSTITQQLAKNLFLSPEKTLLRKINEAFLSMLLELRFDKDSIITAYINEVFLLQQNRIAVHGFERASRMLFRRSVEHLQPQHLALLIGMVKGPTRYNPFKYPERALKRRNLVLRILFEQGLLETNEFTSASNAPLGIVDRLPGVNPFPAYLDLVKRQLPINYPSHDLSRRGLQVFTSFDPQVQRNLELGLNLGLQRFEQPELQTAVVIADYLNGDIQALVGDRVTDFPGFNRAIMAQRPIGSLIKPLLLYSLLKGDMNLASLVEDRSIRIRQSDGKIWEPRNYDRKLHGKMTLYQAFIRSYNLPFVQLGIDGGLEPLAQNLARMKLLKHDVVYPSMLLGTTAMSAFEVAQMFQVIANNGYFSPLTTIRSVSDNTHRTLERVPLESYKLFDQARVLQVQRALIGVSESGTAAYLSSRFKNKSVAGKTGTTNDARDSWFAGFSDRLLTVVWLGRDDNQPIHLSGAGGALRLWSDIMERQGFESFRLTRDGSLKWLLIDPHSGGIVRQSCANGVLLPFPQGRLPSKRSLCP